MITILALVVVGLWITAALYASQEAGNPVRRLVLTAVLATLILVLVAAAAGRS